MINKMNSKLECQQDVILEVCALMKRQSTELCSIKSPLGRVDVDMKNLEISKPQGSPRSVARSHSKNDMSLGRVDVDMKKLEITKPQGSLRSVARSSSKTDMSAFARVSSLPPSKEIAFARVSSLPSSKEIALANQIRAVINNGRVDVDMKKLEITKPQGSPRSVARSHSKTDIDYRAYDYRAYMAQLEACEEYEPNVSTLQAQMAGAMYQSLDFHQKCMQTARLLGDAEEEDKARLKVQQCKQRLEMRPGLLIGASDGVYVSEAGSSAVSRVESAGARVNSLPPSNKSAYARVSSLPPSKEIAFARVSSLPSSKEIAFANQIRAGINSKTTRTAK